MKPARQLTSAQYWPDTVACTSVSDPSPTGSSETQRTGIECQLNGTFVCLYTCRNAFYIKGAHNLLLQRLWVFTKGTARSDTGCQPPVHAVIWIRTVATVYSRISWTVRCTFHYRYARRLSSGRLWPVTDREKKKRKPLKQPQHDYNGVVRSYLATTSIGSISALSAANQTAALTSWLRLRKARVPQRVRLIWI